jgi:hypothetical protein
MIIVRGDLNDLGQSGQDIGLADGVGTPCYDPAVHPSATLLASPAAMENEDSDLHRYLSRQALSRDKSTLLFKGSNLQVETAIATSCIQCFLVSVLNRAISSPIVAP